MNRNSPIYVAGHTGLVGSAILRTLREGGYRRLIYASHRECDLTERKRVEALFKKKRPEYVFLAAAKVGGIRDNSAYPADYIYQNLMIQTNVIDLSCRYGVKRLIFLGSSCIYPKICPQPIREEYLLRGQIEPTNEPYAVAKIAGIKMCQAYNRQYGTKYVAVIPANVYGINDRFHEGGHVAAGLMRRFHEAKERGLGRVSVWGTGKPEREFLYVDDLAEACVVIIRARFFGDLINIGSGKIVSVAELAGIIKKIVGYRGRIVFDRTKPDGMPRRYLSSEKITALGWEAKADLEEKLVFTYEWYKKSLSRER